MLCVCGVCEFSVWFYCCLLGVLRAFLLWVLVIMVSWVCFSALVVGFICCCLVLLVVACCGFCGFGVRFIVVFVLVAVCKVLLLMFVLMLLLVIVFVVFLLLFFVSGGRGLLLFLFGGCEFCAGLLRFGALLCLFVACDLCGVLVAWICYLR